MSPAHHSNTTQSVGPTQQSVEAYAASIREYYAMLKVGISLEQQTELIQKMHKCRDELLLCVLIDHGQTDLIRYVKSARAYLSAKHHKEEE